jgi:hypothetical protein
MIGTRTIAAHYDPALCRTVASARGEDLLARVPQLQVARIEVDDFATVPNLDMTVEVAAGKSGPLSATQSVASSAQASPALPGCSPYWSARSMAVDGERQAVGCRCLARPGAASCECPVGR